jgi:DnaK suppressor protein
MSAARYPAEAPFLNHELRMMHMAAEARARLLQRRAAIRQSLEKGQRPPCDALVELEETDAAIERIDQGRFGRCETCGGAIGRQRLLAFPAARFCIHCMVTAKISP